MLALLASMTTDNDTNKPCKALPMGTLLTSIMMPHKQLAELYTPDAYGEESDM